MNKDDPRDPQLEHLMQLSIMIALKNVRSMQPGKVLSYDADAQSVAVQIQVQEAHVAENGDRVAETVTQINDVPVAFLGNGSGRVTVPVKAGDLGMIVFSSRSMDTWKQTGGVVDPEDDRLHDVNDCMFYPGAHVLGKAPTPAPDDAIVTHGLTKIGGPVGTEKTIRADTYRAAEDALNSAFFVFATVITAYTQAVAVVLPLTAPAAGAVLTGLNSALVPSFSTFLAAIATYKSTLAEVL